MEIHDEQFQILFTGLIREKLNQFRAISIKIVNSGADADDAVQAALLKAWRKRRAFKSDTAALGGWVARIVVTESYDLLRKKGRESKKLLFYNPEAGGDNSAAMERLDRAIVKLPEIYRETVNIAILSGIDTREAADILGCSSNTLYQRIHKAKELLRRLMEEMKHEY